MLSNKNGKAYRNFYDAVRDEAVLDRRSTLLVGLAAAISVGCEP